MKLTIIRGLPGSGKSTLAKSMGIFHVEADMYHTTSKDGYKFQPDKIKQAHGMCQRAVEFAMEEGLDCVVSNTFTQMWEVLPYLEMALEYGYETEIIRLTADHGNIHQVPEEVIATMKSRFEPITNEVIR